MIKFLSEPYLGSVKNPQFIRYTRLKNGHLQQFDCAQCKQVNSHYLILRKPRTCRFLIRHCVFLQALISHLDKSMDYLVYLNLA